MALRLPKLPDSYKKPRDLFGRYWRTYGGLSAVKNSPYMHAAGVLTVFGFPIWIADEWWGYPLSILPNIVGFTIGGYAILVAFNDEKFRALLAGSTRPSKASPYMTINAAFMHFIVVQCIAILIGVIGKAYAYISPVKIAERVSKDGVGLADVILYPLGIVVAVAGTLAFFYALMSVIAATANIFRVAGWYDKMIEGGKEDSGAGSGSAPN